MCFGFVDYFKRRNDKVSHALHQVISVWGRSKYFPVCSPQLPAVGSPQKLTT